MTTKFLYDFISKHKYAVLSSVTADNFPESAYVGFAVKQDLKIIFDTVSTSRKYLNLIKNPLISFVIGCDNDQTVQYEGTAKILTTNELDDLIHTDYKVFPDGIERKENWKDLAFILFH